MRCFFDELSHSTSRHKPKAVRGQCTENSRPPQAGRVHSRLASMCPGCQPPLGLEQPLRRRRAVCLWLSVPCGALVGARPSGFPQGGSGSSAREDRTVYHHVHSSCALSTKNSPCTVQYLLPALRCTGNPSPGPFDGIVWSLSTATTTRTVISHTRLFSCPRSSLF
jgi:hypothetical protein